jgi:hypothetical protein
MRILDLLGGVGEVVEVEVGEVGEVEEVGEAKIGEYSQVWYSSDQHCPFPA